MYFLHGLLASVPEVTIKATRSSRQPSDLLNPRSSLQRTECRVEGIFLITREMNESQYKHQRLSAQALTRLDELSNRTSEQLQHLQEQIADSARYLQSTRPIGHSDREGPSEHTDTESTSATTIGIRLTQVPTNLCVECCSCVCHKPGRLVIDFLGPFIGSLFVGYTGLPNITPPCNEYTCKKNRHRATFSARLTYFFPSWFLTRMIYSVVNYTARDGPQILFVKAPRLRSGNTSIFHHAQDGDIRAIREAFATGDASPFDVHASITRPSLLHVSGP